MLSDTGYYFFYSNIKNLKLNLWKTKIMKKSILKIYMSLTFNVQIKFPNQNKQKALSTLNYNMYIFYQSYILNFLLHFDLL